MFGSFIHQGGKIIDSSHQFKFINDDGTHLGQADQSGYTAAFSRFYKLLDVQ
tara:strand:+ start:301 stop:456 length:156 start_codon:yes stop_codon:yes gene_type:complete